MKYLPWLLLVIGGLIVYLLWPSPSEPDYSAHENRIKLREQAVRELQVENTKLLTRIKSDSVSHKIEIQTYKDRDKIRVSEIARIKASKVVIQVRDSVPEIDSLIVAYDSLLESKDQQILLSEKYVSTLQIDIGELKNNFEERLALQSQTITDQQTIISDQRRQLQKEKRRNKITKIVTVTAAIAGFFLGSQL